MTQPRQSQVSLSDTLYYHCISCSVRRTYLCKIVGVQFYTINRYYNTARVHLDINYCSPMEYEVLTA